MTGGSIVIAIGNPYRSDDGVAARVLDRVRHAAPWVRCVEHDGEPARLVDLWDGAGLAVVVDACRTGGRAGTVHCLDLSGGSVPVSSGAVSGHGLGLAEAVGLANLLHRLPPRLHVVAVDVEDLRAGTELSPPVAAAVPEMVNTVIDLLTTGSAGPGGTAAQRAAAWRPAR